MKLNFLILLTYLLLLQSAEASKKKKGGSRLGRIFINICQICQILNLTRPNLSPYQQSENIANTSVVPRSRVHNEKENCQFALPLAADKAMEFLICSNEIRTANFFDQYLQEAKNDGKRVFFTRSCKKLLKLYNRVKDRVCTPAMKNLETVVNGAMQRILGEKHSRDEHNDMFKEWLWNAADVQEDHSEAYGGEIGILAKMFERLKKPDFFLIMRATDFFKEHERLSTVDALKEAMKKNYQGVDFDQVSRSLPYVRFLKVPSNFHEWWYLDYIQLKMAIEGPLKKLDFDRIDDVATNLKDYSLLNRQSVEILTDPKNQDMDWIRVIDMIPIASFELKREHDFTGSHWGPLWDDEKIKMIFDRKHQYNDPLRYKWMYQMLQELAPLNDFRNRTLSRESWITCDDFDFAKIEEIFHLCRDAPKGRGIACYKENIKPLKKKGKLCKRGGLVRDIKEEDKLNDDL